MKKIWLFFVLLAVLFLLSACVKEEVKVEKGTEYPILTVIYDNYPYKKGLKTGWGFACLVEWKGKKILFDTGGDSPTLSHNMKKLNIFPQEIDAVVLSHNHWDHVGGLPVILSENNNISVYGLKSFPESFSKRLKKFTAIDKSIKIKEGIYSTGQLEGTVEEQALILDTEEGLVIITGCAHPGVVNIIKKSKDLLKKPAYLVLGGFHLGDKSESAIKNIIGDFKKLEVSKVGPSHCTGDRAIELFREAYGENFVKIGVGKVIVIKKGGL